MQKEIIGWKPIQVNKIYLSSFSDSKRVYLEQKVREQMIRKNPTKYGEAPSDFVFTHTKRRVLFKDMPFLWEKDDVINFLVQFPHARLLKVLKNDLILTPRDMKIIKSKEYTERKIYLEKKRNNQLIPRKKDGIVFYSGPDMYMRYILSLNGGVDIDLRNEPKRIRMSDILKKPDTAETLKEVEFQTT